MARGLRFAALVLVLTQVATLQQASAALSGGVCMMTLELDFDQTVTAASVGFPLHSLTFSATSSSCTGTSDDDLASITLGSASGVITCEAIAVVGDGTLNYPPGGGDFTAVITGNVDAVVLAMSFPPDVVEGAGAFSTLLGVQTLDCVEDGLSEVTMSGALVFTDPTIDESQSAEHRRAHVRPASWEQAIPLE